jgi:hypothetical protein
MDARTVFLDRARPLRESTDRLPSQPTANRKGTNARRRPRGDESPRRPPRTPTRSRLGSSFLEESEPVGVVADQ